MCPPCLQYCPGSELQNETFPPTEKPETLHGFSFDRKQTWNLNKLKNRLQGDQCGQKQRKTVSSSRLSTFKPEHIQMWSREGAQTDKTSSSVHLWGLMSVLRFKHDPAEMIYKLWRVFSTSKDIWWTDIIMGYLSNNRGCSWSSYLWRALVSQGVKSSDHQHHHWVGVNELFNSGCF